MVLMKGTKRLSVVIAFLAHHFFTRFPDFSNAFNLTPSVKQLLNLLPVFLRILPPILCHEFLQSQGCSKHPSDSILLILQSRSSFFRLGLFHSPALLLP